MIMKRTTFWWLGCVFVWITLWTQVAQAQVFWKITGKGLQQPSYLLGSMHVYDGSRLLEQAAVKQAFDSSSVFVGELEMNSSAMFELFAEMVMPGDTTLQDLLSQEEYQRVDRYMQEKMGVGLGFFGRMRPIFLYFLFTTIDEAERMQAQGDSSFSSMNVDGLMDVYLQRTAREAGKEVRALETVREQIQALTGSMSLQEQARTLADYVKNGSTQKSDKQKALQLVEAYKKQDLKRMAKLLRENFDEQQYRLLIVERNRRWLPKMEAIMQKAPAFFVVGAGHLVGEEGLLVQLQRLGYRLEPLPLKLE